MNIGYFEDDGYRRLLPLTWPRACFELRCGRDLLVDKVRAHLGPPATRLWLREAIHRVVAERCGFRPPEAGQDWCLLNARTLLTANIKPPEVGTVWRAEGELVAVAARAADVDAVMPDLFRNPEALENWLRRFRPAEVPDGVRLVRYPWDLILANPAELRRQCQDGGRHDGQVDAGAHLLCPGQICIERGARIKPGAVLDAEDGPIHIGENALIQPNAVLLGPCCIGPGSIVRPGAVIREGTTIGPVCKVGGEIEASIIQGYTNKQHDGFLGHSFLGEWVNLGADTITSDLKNTYGAIRVLLNGVGVETGQHFVGSIIGDHSKTGIGTILPTGCVVGVAANVFTHRSVPKFVPSFAWLTDAGMTAYHVDKAVRLARVVMGRRDVELSGAEQHLLEQVADEAREVEAAGWN